MKLIFLFFSFVFLAWHSSNAQDLQPQHQVHFVGTKEGKSKFCVSFSGYDLPFLIGVRENLSKLYASRGFLISNGDKDCTKKGKIKGFCQFQPYDLKPEKLLTKFHFYKDYDFNIKLAKEECDKIKENYSGFAITYWVDQNRTWMGI